MKQRTNFTKSYFALLICLFFLSNSSIAQSWEWAIHGGGTTSDKGTAIVTDANGFSYVTGYFNEAADFGAFNMPLIDEHSKEVFIAKVDPNGNYVWVRRGSNHYDDRGLGICLDPAGNIFVTGTCWGGIIFDGLSEYNSTWYTDQIFVVKLDTDGNFIWLKNAGNDYGDDHGHDLVSDNLGNIYVTGFVSNWSFGCGGASQAVFGTHTIPLDNCDSLGFVAKLSNDGNWLWAKSFGGVDGERDNRIAIDLASNVYVSGGFTGTRDFGTATITSEGGVDIFVTKYDQNGTFQFVKNTGSTLDDRANDITVDKNNYVYITGEFRDHVAFGTDTVNNNGGANGRDIFVSRMDVNGNWIWATKAGSNDGGDRGCGITSNQHNNVFVTGQFKGSADFGNSLNLSTSSPDSIQIFVAAIDTAGDWNWALQAGGVDDDERGNAVSCDTSCNLYCTGYYRQNNSYGTHSVSNFGGRDIFIAKIDQACFDVVIDDTIIDDDDTVIVIPPTPVDPPPYLEERIYVPNTFTPNGDERNQTFKPSISSSVLPSNYSLKIYNKWGQLIFESRDFEVGWDGTYGTYLVQNGIYVWKMDFDIGKKHYHEIGHVQVIK